MKETRILAQTNKMKILLIVSLLVNDDPRSWTTTLFIRDQELWE
jgi:hypothetical protein